MIQMKNPFSTNHGKRWVIMNESGHYMSATGQWVGSLNRATRYDQPQETQHYCLQAFTEI